jgi:hypothetical protein
MSTPQLRTSATRLAGAKSSLRWNGRHLLAARSKSITPARAFSTQIQSLQAEGVLDDKGLVNFDTLHDLHMNSCKTFGSAELFGTFNKDKKIFEWDTYTVFGEQVMKTRAVLKDIGE